MFVSCSCDGGWCSCSLLTLRSGDGSRGIHFVNVLFCRCYGDAHGCCCCVNLLSAIARATGVFVSRLC
jgi:hypothetical protein